MELITTCAIDVPTLEAVITALFNTEYNDGNFAVLAEITYNDGEVENVPVSVNLPEKASMLNPPKEFFLKNWSEGKPLADALLQSGLIKETKTSVTSGFVTVPIVSLTVS